MKIRVKLVLLSLVFSSSFLLAQTKPAKIWATATFNKSEVQLGEPLMVTVTVYTSTWFTKPPVFDEIQVKGSLMVKLEQNGGATTVTIGKNRYPAIQQKFVVYPNIIGKNTLPSFKVTTECPPEGGYKGITRDVFSKERNFNVLGPPEGVDPKNYVATYNLSVKDYWNTDLSKVKAGDVLERRITYNASGSLAATIPPTKIDSIDFGTIYSKTPILNNRQNQNSFSGTRTEIYTYLLETDGIFEIPEISVEWYNLKSRTLETSTIDAIPLNIASNPDLEFILSRQKELQAELEANKEEEPEVKEPFSFMGLNWWQLTLAVLGSIVILKYVIQFIRLLVKKQKEHHKQVMDSEGHFYKELKQTVKKGNTAKTLQAFYSWYDRYRPNKLGPQGKNLFEGNKKIEEEADDVLVSLYSSKGSSSKLHFGDLMNFISKKRKETTTTATSMINSDHINP